VFYGGIPGAGKILLVRTLPSVTGEISIEESSDAMHIAAIVNLFLTNEISMK
jgi:hypothetical protein